MALTIGSGITFGSGISLNPPGGPVLGQSFGGGYYAGQISLTSNGVATHYLIVAPKATGETTRVAQIPYDTYPGANSRFNGLSNTNTLSTGNHPAAAFCLGLSIGGYNDWYLPATLECEIAYYNLKPNTTLNVTNVGNNFNAVPQRPSNYTTGTPARTSATLFQAGGAEAFTASNYWTSDFSPGNGSAYAFDFNNGLSDNSNSEYNTFYVRAFRRIAI
jgi:hypothetical protein